MISLPTLSGPVPVLLLTGFLGAGKTTAINHLLSAPHGRRLAAVVNDFGAINIDAELITGASEGVVSLRNGCICCSLQGDLLRTLATLLRRDPPPDGVVIEASGVADPTDIVRGLLDPVIWQAATLDAVVCMVDGRQVLDNPRVTSDRLCRAQIAAADFVAVNKVDLLSKAERQEVRTRVSAIAPRARSVECALGQIAPEILFGAAAHQPSPTASSRLSAASPPPFDTLSWTCDAPLSLPRFQAVIGKLAPQLLRAKGILQFLEQPDRPMLFQFAGRRATLGAAPTVAPGQTPVRLVLIAERGGIDAAAVRTMLTDCRMPA